ncbi:prepilin-type N-terminal cleavage/methylation domain-containing protein [Bacillus piscicola]|uniref:prepilin-type N-terminal cleavage/methylation domain-containing protein n=1 Tax=Bacillus piscicola TaxID=1632684 RepID=UPI001F09CD97|nr:prepilin-type N-terminal cleavage/methylation domain-containing protein [Bacillus piscicola]
MRHLVFKNKNGFTLIELLLALTLSTIVISLVSYVLFQAINQFSFTVDHSFLRQEAGIISTTIEERYLTTEKTIQLTTLPPDHLKIDESVMVMESYHVYIEITNQSNGHIDRIASASAGDGTLSCGDEGVPSGSSSTSMDGKNKDGYHLHIKLFSTEKPCDTYEVVTHISKL